MHFATVVRTIALESFTQLPMYTKRNSLIAVGAVTTLLGCVVIGIRAYIWCARKRKQGLDDLWIGLAWIFSIGFAISSFVSVGFGVGFNSADVLPNDVMKAVLSVYFIEVFYYLCIFSIKMSLLCLYLRMTSGLRTLFWKATIITMIVVVLQFVSTMLVTFLQCRPLHKYWIPPMPGHCIDLNAFFYSTNIFTIISDCVILVLPIQLVWSIQRSRQERWGVLAVFLVGFFSTLISCVRLYSIRIYTLSPDPIQDAAPINMWSFIEIYSGMLCVSTPVMKALFSRPARKESHRELSSTDGSSSSGPGRWQPKRSYQVTTSDSSKSGIQFSNMSTISCVESGEGTRSVISQQSDTIWDGREPSASVWNR